MTSAHNMPCPICKVPLAMSDRQGVEIDYCPQCRGVWLDRGELDKIIERNASEFGERSAQPAPQPQPYPQSAPYPQSDHYRGAPPPHDGYGYGHDKRHKYPKRRKSFLEELFD